MTRVTGDRSHAGFLPLTGLFFIFTVEFYYPRKVHHHHDPPLDQKITNPPLLDSTRSFVSLLNFPFSFFKTFKYTVLGYFSVPPWEVPSLAFFLLDPPTFLLLAEFIHSFGTAKNSSSLQVFRYLQFPARSILLLLIERSFPLARVTSDKSWIAHKFPRLLCNTTPFVQFNDPFRLVLTYSIQPSEAYYPRFRTIPRL